MTGLLAALPDQQLSLSALAEWVRGLPVSSLAPVGVLFVAGLLLACFGQRLLKPVLVLASMFFGVVLLARLGPTLSASIPPLAWSAIGAVGGIIVAVLSYRLLLGIAMGLVGATVAILLALTAVAFLGSTPIGGPIATLRATLTGSHHPPGAFKARFNSSGISGKLQLLLASTQCVNRPGPAAGDWILNSPIGTGSNRRIQHRKAKVTGDRGC